MRSRWLTAGALSVLAMVAATQLAGSGYTAPLAGLPDAGLVTTWIAKLAGVAFTVLGVRMVGELVSVTFLAQTTHDTVTHDSRVRLRRLAAVSASWAATSVIAGISWLAVLLGVSLSDALRPGVLPSYVMDLAVSRNFMLAALLAIAIAIVCAVAVALNWALLATLLTLVTIALPLLNSHAANLGDHSLAISSSLVHGVAASLWVGTLWSTVPALRAGNRIEVARYERIAVVSVVALFTSGLAAAYARLDGIGDLVHTGYGRIVVVKVALFAIAIAIAAAVRARVASSPARFVSVEVVIMALAIGAGVAVHNTAPSRTGLRLNSAGEDLLGFNYPDAPTASSMIFGWHPEYLMLLALSSALGLYLWGVRRTSGWPALRTVSFTAGIAVAAWATNAGVAKYSMVSFSAHMIAHMALSMMAPILIAMSAPVTLLLRALPATSPDGSRSPRHWVTALLHSGYATLLSNPVIVLALFTVGLYGLYFTSLFSALMSDHTGHTLMGAHFLLVGLLFSYTVIGIDPQPRPLPYPMRMILVLVAMAIHGFFGIALMQQTVPVGNRWYSQVRPPWIDNPLTDTYRGGGVAWALGEIPSLVLMLAIAVMWSRSDTRLAKRLDRQADRDGDAELKAYNERLADLNRRGS